MSVDALRRQSAMQALDAIKKSGEDVTSVLREQVQALSRVFTRTVLPHFEGVPGSRITLRGGHNLEFTCTAHSSDTIYLGSGDGTVSAWALESPDIAGPANATKKPLSQIFIIKGKPKLRVHGRKQCYRFDILGVKINRHPYARVAATSRIRDPFQEGHFGAVTTLAASADGAFVASAGLDCLVNVRNGRTGKSVFTIILDNVALSMRIFGHVLTVCTQSVIRVFNLDNSSEMFLLRGHEDQITGCAVISEEQYGAITCSLDKSVRYFDYSKQTQLIFSADAVLESVCWPDSDVFIAGSPAGLFIYSKEKKKYIAHVHPYDTLKFLTAEAADTFKPSNLYCRRTVTALDCIPNGDLVVSGCHGLVSLWKYSNLTLEKVADYAVPGFVNDLSIYICYSKIYILVALGKVPARGRWDSDAAGYNGALMLDIHCAVSVEQKKANRFRSRTLD